MRMLVTALVVLILGGYAAAEDAKNTQLPKNNCEKNCELKGERVHLDINANTGQVSGGTRFPQGATVQVVLTHKNPFKYQYRVEVVAAPLEQAIVTGFLTKFILPFGELGKLTNPIGTPPPVTSALAPVPKCNAEDAENWGKVHTAATLATEAHNALVDGFNSRAKTYKAYEEFVKKTDTDTLPQACDELCKTANALASSLSSLIDLGDVPEKATAFAEAAKALDTAITTFKATKNSECQKEHAKELEASEALAKKGPDVQAEVKQLKDAKSDFEAFQKLLNNVLAEEYLFKEPFYPPTVGTATGITVSVFRTNLRQVDPKEKKVATVFIQIGESMVSVAAGIAFTTTPDQRIGRVPAMVPGADGKDTLGNRFDYLENGGGRALAVAMLNGRLPVSSVGWWRALPDVLSTGVGLRLDSAGPTQADWIPLAFGWRLGSDHVLLTAALHLTRSDCLPGKASAPAAAGQPAAVQSQSRCNDRQGFRIGDVVPASLGDPLPVQRIWNRGFLFGVTFRTQ